LVAEMKELKANPDRPAIATVLESHLDNKLWPVATVLINTWVMNKWDSVVCSDSFWKIKLMKDYENKSIVKAFPGDPVLIVWLDKVVNGWDYLQVVSSLAIAKQKAEEYRTIIQNREKNKSSWLDVLMSKIKAWNLKQLKIVLKADTNWSLEAIKAALIKLSTPETNVSIIHSWVGSITEGDVLMCEWSDALLIWFNVWVVSTAKSS
jgi:translation initiation factor IF-2